MHCECKNHVDAILLTDARVVTSLEADARCHAGDDFQNRIFQFFQIVVSSDRRFNSMGCLAMWPGVYFGSTNDFAVVFP